LPARVLVRGVPVSAAELRQNVLPREPDAKALYDVIESPVKGTYFSLSGHLVSTSSALH
jgi:hypothetical protein